MSDGERSSRVPGFYKLSTEERLRVVQRFAGLSDEDAAALRGSDPERLGQAARMIENVVGLFHFPVGFAANFRLDGRDRLLPMVIEEPSVVAAASNAAKLLRGGDGILTEATAPWMIGQIQLCHVPEPEAAIAALREAAPRLIDRANETQPRLVARGGGARELEVRWFPETPAGPMLVVHLLADVQDAMGANLINGMVETLAPECETLTGGEAYLRILSNLADQRLVRAVGRVPVAALARPKLGWSGEEVADRVVAASAFAEVDPYRAATHNKGIMNGVDAFLIGVGQDWRAVEAGVHAYAAQDGSYTALATWRREGAELVGRITLPMQVGSVGGVVRVHPVVKVLLKVAETERASDIGRAAAAIGLAQNLAAILALATEGIQRGHMSLHARNIAAAAGVTDDRTMAHVVAEMIRRHSITHAAAETILAEARAEEAASRASDSSSTADLERLGATHWPAIERRILSLSPEREPLGRMLRYWMGTGGKRLRAILPLAAYEGLGRDPVEVVPFAAAMELLHNATLIHEDAESRTRTRRGQDAAWVRFGLDQAINLGDAMFYGALKCLDTLSHPPERVRRLTSLLVGEMLSTMKAQIGSRDADTPILELAQDRVGRLLGLALSGSALLGGASPEAVERLGHVGGHLGVLFTIQDDLTDLTGQPGRPRGSSIVSGRRTLLTDHCLANAPRAVAAELKTILDRPAHQTSASAVARASELLSEHGSLAYAGDLIREHQAAVEEHANELGEDGPQQLLRGLTDIFFAPLLRDLDAAG